MANSGITATFRAGSRSCPLVVLIATILGMIFEKQTGISLTVAGCIGALVLVITGVLTEKQAYKAIDSQTIFIFGGTWRWLKRWK